MRIIKTLIYLLIISIFLSACSRPNPNTDSTENIVPPENQLIPIKGTWEISEVLTTESSDEEDIDDGPADEWLGSKVQFSDNYMSLRDTALENPKYQIKRVSSEGYIMFNSRTLPSGFNLPNKTVEVITVIDEDRFFCEVLIIEEDKLMLKIHGNSFYLNKVSDEVEEFTSSENDDQGNQESNILIDEDNPIRTGVLIGLRSKNQNNSEDYSYRTLWISSVNNETDSILEMENIFFPRRSGFWKIEVEKAERDGKSEEYIIANNTSMEENKIDMQLKNRIMGIQSQGLTLMLEEDISPDLDFFRSIDKVGHIKRKIDYVGNDYISVETTGKGEYTLRDGTWEKSKLELLPVDVLPGGSGVKISDILKEDGTIAMKSAWERAVDNLEIDSPSILYREELLENFGLERKLGHWFIKGRINYIKDKEFNIYDYNINVTPPSKVVFYDALLVPWTNIKDVVPRAIDAYTSPNKDIALIFTKDELLIYDIHGNDLERLPKERIDLKNGETVIMAEWATGQYVESWKDIFQKSGGEEVEY